MLAVILITFFVLLFIGAPIGISMGVACMPYFIFTDGAMGITIAQRIFTVTDSFTLCDTSMDASSITAIITATNLDKYFFIPFSPFDFT